MNFVHHLLHMYMLYTSYRNKYTRCSTGSSQVTLPRLAQATPSGATIPHMSSGLIPAGWWCRLSWIPAWPKDDLLWTTTPVLSTLQVSTNLRKWAHTLASEIRPFPQVFYHGKNSQIWKLICFLQEWWNPWCTKTTWTALVPMREVIQTCTRREEPLPLSLTLCGTKMATPCAASPHLTRDSMKARTVASLMTGQLLCLKKFIACECSS